MPHEDNTTVSTLQQQLTSDSGEAKTMASSRLDESSGQIQVESPPTSRTEDVPKYPTEI